MKPVCVYSRSNGRVAFDFFFDFVQVSDKEFTRFQFFEVVAEITFSFHCGRSAPLSCFLRLYIFRRPAMMIYVLFFFLWFWFSFSRYWLILLTLTFHYFLVDCKFMYNFIIVNFLISGLNLSITAYKLKLYRFRRLRKRPFRL